MLALPAHLEIDSWNGVTSACPLQTGEASTLPQSPPPHLVCSTQSLSVTIYNPPCIRILW